MKTLDTLFDQYAHKTVEILPNCPKEKLRGIKAIVIGVDPRPLGHAENDWLCIKYSEGTKVTYNPSKVAVHVESYATDYVLPHHVKIV